jgi:hypothetical protein
MDESWSQEEIETANDMLRLCFPKAFSELSGEGSRDVQDRGVRETRKAHSRQRSKTQSCRFCRYVHSQSKFKMNVDYDRMNWILHAFEFRQNQLLCRR